MCVIPKSASSTTLARWYVAVPSSRSSVIPSKRSPRLGARLAVTILPLALPDGPVVPREPEPFQVADDLLLPAGHVPLWVGVVDPQ